MKISMKKAMLTALLCFINTQALAQSPMQVQKTSMAEVKITSLQNNLEIYAISVNRNNCMPILSLDRGQVLNYGDSFNAIAVGEKTTKTYFSNEVSNEALHQMNLFINMGVKQYCTVLEMTIDSSAGQWTFSWENK